MAGSREAALALLVAGLASLTGLVGIEEGAQFGEERRVRLGLRSTGRRGAGTTGSGGRDGVAGRGSGA
ncbi:hypothetical protein, partial [Streptomyces luridiscabiei]|uniref:hypothetical protein n=1 Tax=Streptomyces luridiscabiei TaxID=164114 RepID=UPI00131C9C9C